MITDHFPNGLPPRTRMAALHEGSGHRWMMLACCVPMLVIAIVLVATGVLGAGVVFLAIGCTVMMALMMGAMSHGGGGDPRHRSPDQGRSQSNNLMRTSGDQRQASRSDEAPAERFARGEIDEDEFTPSRALLHPVWGNSKPSAGE